MRVVDPSSAPANSALPASRPVSRASMSAGARRSNCTRNASLSRPSAPSAESLLSPNASCTFSATMRSRFQAKRPPPESGAPRSSDGCSTKRASTSRGAPARPRSSASPFKVPAGNGPNAAGSKRAKRALPSNGRASSIVIAPANRSSPPRAVATSSLVVMRLPRTSSAPRTVAPPPAASSAAMARTPSFQLTRAVARSSGMRPRSGLPAAALASAIVPASPAASGSSTSLASIAVVGAPGAKRAASNSRSCTVARLTGIASNAATCASRSALAPCASPVPSTFNDASGPDALAEARHGAPSRLPSAATAADTANGGFARIIASARTCVSSCIPNASLRSAWPCALPKYAKDTPLNSARVPSCSMRARAIFTASRCSLNGSPSEAGIALFSAPAFDRHVERFDAYQRRAHHHGKERRKLERNDHVSCLDADRTGRVRQALDVHAVCEAAARPLDRERASGGQDRALQRPAQAGFGLREPADRESHRHQRGEHQRCGPLHEPAGHQNAYPTDRCSRTAFVSCP